MAPISRSTVALELAAVLLASGAGCEIIAGADRERLAQIGAPQGGAGGEAPDTGGAGGLAMAECTQASDCPDPMSPCLLRACDSASHTCTPAFVGDMTPVPDQVPMDCLEVVCDGKGGTKEIDDLADVFDDANDCTDDVCIPVGPMNAISAPGTACDEAGGTTCDGAGSCVECVADADCLMGVCEPLSKTCVPETCGDGIENGDETDLDCGNQCGPTCGPGQACDDAADCAPPSTRCMGSVCT